MKKLILISEAAAPAGFDCAANNPCQPLETPGRFHYMHADKTKFVQCAQNGGCSIITCPAPLIFFNDIQVCNFAFMMHGWGK